ncbi:MAG: transposase [Planctomycetaceae bacterium]
MPGKAAKIELTELMHEILQGIASSRSIGTAIVTRATIILMAFLKHSNQTIGEQLECCCETVGKWRRRWRDSYAALLSLQFAEPKVAFRQAIIDCLRDAPRSGSTGKFSPEQIVGLIAIACEPPEQSQRPVTTWIGKELADEAKKRRLIESISASHVHRILREADLQPHKSQYWCNTTEKDRERFQQQVQAVCQTYLEATERYRRSRTHTVCVDEMTSLQANERCDKTKPALPGKIAKEEFNYLRHGTVCMTANWDVVTGQLLAPTLSDTRDNHDFAKHIEQMIATDPSGNWVIVLDNLNTHCSEQLVRLIASQLGIDQSTLGVVKKYGSLKDMQTRRTFLSDPTHRIRFVYLPKHSSWLNQIEIIFGVISRRVLRHGNFTSKDDLIDKLKRFMVYFNETSARTMNWTYTGRPTRNTPNQRTRTWRELRRPAKPWKKTDLVTAKL